ncbi:MAG TPA: glycosyltransferase family 39 protein, partial [Solirubrobacteraceae bacterium]
GRELAGARTALLCGAIVAVNPLFVWYSQEARVYGLFVFTAAVAILCFLRADALEPGDPASARRLAAFALSGAVALLTHYFAVFLLVPMVLWLGRDRARLRAALGAIVALTLVGLALLPLISAQGGHGTQWIGRWPISDRLQAIPQYYLTGYSGAPLGHGVELLVALIALVAAGFGLWRMSAPQARGVEISALDRHERHGALIMATLATVGILTPVLLALLGADYLAPRNLVAAMIPVTALIAVLAATRTAARTGAALAAVLLLAFLVISLDVELSPRLQRGNWRGVARALGTGDAARAITTVELGGAPLEYYLPGLHNLHSSASVRVSEIDETGYAPLRASAGSPPAPGFRLFARLNVDGLIVYRFRSATARVVSEATLREHVITLARPEVLVPGNARLSA